VELLKVSALSSNTSTKQTKIPEYKKKRAIGLALGIQPIVPE
jgi:hypothetical protein